MKLLESFFTSGAGLTFVAIVIVLAVIGIIAFLFYKVKQKKWAKYPLLFVLVSVALLAFDRLIDYWDMPDSLILSLTSGAIFVLFVFLGDRSKEKKK